MDGEVSKLEFLCDAIAEYSGSHDPRSAAYKARNPLGLKVFNVGELRKFRSWTNGYEAAIFDLKAKCSGRNRKLSGYSTIRDLTQHFGMAESAAENVANYLSFALEDAKITAETQLFIFLR